MKNYRWNGEPVKKVRFGYVVQKANEEQPMYWYNWEVAKQKALEIEPCMIPAIEVTGSWGDPFLIANIAGVGVNKLEAGGMWRHQHFTLDGKFYEDEAFAVREFSNDDFNIYQTGLDKWQKENYPDAWQRVQDLKNSFAQQKIDDLKTIPLVDQSGNALIKRPSQGVSGATKYHKNGKK